MKGAYLPSIKVYKRDVKLPEWMHCVYKGCWFPRSHATCRVPMGCCEAFCVPCSTILLDFILHLFYFWFFRRVWWHVKIKKWETVFSDSEVFLRLFVWLSMCCSSIYCLSDFYFWGKKKKFLNEITVFILHWVWKSNQSQFYSVSLKPLFNH